jgi:hypothetical protein
MPRVVPCVPQLRIAAHGGDVESLRATLAEGVDVDTQFEVCLCILRAFQIHISLSLKPVFDMGSTRD